jgi:hypothetical protein
MILVGNGDLEMAWLVVEDDDGAWENVALDGVDSVSFDGKGTVYIMRKGLPPKGVRPRVIYVAGEPALRQPSRANPPPTSMVAGSVSFDA